MARDATSYSLSYVRFNVGRWMDLQQMINILFSVQEMVDLLRFYT